MASWFNEIVSAGKSIVTDAVSKTVLDVAGLMNPSLGRLQKSGLIKDGMRRLPNKIEKSNINYSGSVAKKINQDWRVRISSPEQTGMYGVNSGITSPLTMTSGVVFPYTPQITVNHTANYSAQKFTHSNYNFFTYENSEVQVIQINADFTVQNQEEAKYLLACIYFFRSATKMYFGKSPNSGNPPPLVFLDGYGTHYFPHVPCVITQFSHTMPSDVDYIETETKFSQEVQQSGRYSRGVASAVFVNNSGQSINPENGLPYKDLGLGSMGSTRVPTISQLSVTLQPVYSKEIVGNNFNLHDFAKGKLVDKGGFI